MTDCQENGTGQVLPFSQPVKEIASIRLGTDVRRSAL